MNTRKQCGGADSFFFVSASYKWPRERFRWIRKTRWWWPFPVNGRTGGRILRRWGTAAASCARPWCWWTSTRPSPVALHLGSNIQVKSFQGPFPIGPDRPGAPPRGRPQIRTVLSHLTWILEVSQLHSSLLSGPINLVRSFSYSRAPRIHLSGVGVSFLSNPFGQ